MDTTDKAKVGIYNMRIEATIPNHGYTETFYFTVNVINSVTDPPVFLQQLKD